MDNIKGNVSIETKSPSTFSNELESKTSSCCICEKENQNDGVLFKGFFVCEKCLEYINANK